MFQRDIHHHRVISSEPNNRLGRQRLLVIYIHTTTILLIHGIIFSRYGLHKTIPDRLHTTRWSAHTYIHTYIHTYSIFRMVSIYLTPCFSSKSFLLKLPFESMSATAFQFSSSIYLYAFFDAELNRNMMLLEIPLLEYYGEKEWMLLKE